MPTLLTSRGYIFTVAGTKQRCHACHAPPATRNSRSRRVLGQAVGAPANAFFLCECESQHQIAAKSKSSFKAAAAATLHPASPFFSLSFKARAASSYLRRNYIKAKHFAHGTRHTSHVTHLLAASASVFATNSCPPTHQKDAMQHAGTAQKRQ